MNVRFVLACSALLGAGLISGCGNGAGDAAPAAAAGGAQAGGGAAIGGAAMGGAGTSAGSSVMGGSGGMAAASGSGGGPVASGGGSASGGAGGGAGMMGLAGYHAAAHSPFPTIPKFSGPVLATPQLVTVTYAGYKYTKDVEAFGDFVVTSDWITTVGADYGFGTGSHLAKVELADAAPAKMTDDDLQALITTKLADGTLPAPPGNPNDFLYIFYFPKTTQFKRVDGAASCSSFLGFHNGFYTGVNNLRVAYAVIADCGAEPGVPELGVITSTASHELAEAASDPLPYNNPAFNFGGAGTLDPWRLWGSENGDICAGVDYRHSSGAWLQRSWSNANAKIGLDPCVPPAQADASVFSVSPAPSTAQQVVAGQTVTFTLTGWSTVQRPDWDLSYSVWRADFQPKIALGSSTINNGTEVTLTLKVPSSAASGSLFLMTVESRSGAESHPWPIAVYIP